MSYLQITKEEYDKILHKIQMLQNRCFALTHGTLCPFCPYDDCKAFGKLNKEQNNENNN